MGRHLARVLTCREVTNQHHSRSVLESSTIEGDSPVGEMVVDFLMMFPSTTGHVKPCGKLGRPLSKAKYSWSPIVNQYCEGKVKSTPGGE